MYNCNRDRSDRCDSFIKLLEMHRKKTRPRPTPPTPGHNCECPPDDLLWRDLISSASIFNSLKLNLDTLLSLDPSIIAPLLMSFVEMADVLQNLLDNPANTIPLRTRQEAESLVQLYREMGNPANVSDSLLEAIQLNNTTRMLYDTARYTIQRSDLYALAEIRNKRSMIYMGIMKNL